MTEFKVTIPGDPPRINATYKVITIRGRGRLAKHSEVSTWQDGAALLVRVAKPSGWEPSRRVRIEIAWWTTRQRDADSGLKACLDAIATGLGINDSCFLPTIVSNEKDPARPRTEVTIRCES